MDNLIVLTECENGKCCCLSPRSTVALISIIGQVGCIVDILSNESTDVCFNARRHVNSFRSLLLTFFQMANMLLLLGSIVEYAWLLQIYLWYTLAFIVLGFVVSILGFLDRFQEDGIWSFVIFVPETAFLFVMYRCLPLVDSYRKRIDGNSSN